MNTIGERIKKARTEAGITQLQLGNFAGCSGQVISNIERGYSRPAAEILNKIAGYLHVPTDYLLGLSNLQWDVSDPNYISAFVSKRIPGLLAARKMPAALFSTAADLDPDEVTDILSGSVMPNISTLSQIANALDTTIDYLIGSSDHPTKLNSEEEEDIISYYRNMSKSAKRKFMGLLEDLKDK